MSPVDLVIANSTSNNVTVLLGNGDGTFTEAAGSPYAVGTDPSSVVVADFNGDGNLDFAVANRGDNTISVFQGDGKGGFTQFPASPFALQNNATISEKGPVATGHGELPQYNAEQQQQFDERPGSGSCGGQRDHQ